MEIGGNTILVYFTQNGYATERLKPYENFLLECKQKDIESYAKHKHHILPVFMGGGNESDNFIVLTPEDHYNAHLVLAGCFEKGVPEHHYNISAGNCIMRNAKRTLKRLYGANAPTDLVDFWKQANLSMKSLMKGESNPMFGKTHNEEIRKKMSENLKKAYNNGLVAFRTGKKFGPLSNELKEKLSKSLKGRIISEETRLKMSKRKKPITLSSGVFYCVLDLTESQQFYRICGCGKILYYKKLYYANCAEKDEVRCKSCGRKGVSTSLKGKKVGKRPYKVKQPNRNMKGDKNPNSKKMIIVETGEVFNTQKELAKHKGKSKTWLTRQIKLGNIVYGNA